MCRGPFSHSYVGKYLIFNPKYLHFFRSVNIASLQVNLVMDFHAHLCGCEIIGLLGGTWHPKERRMQVDSATNQQLCELDGLFHGVRTYLGCLVRGDFTYELDNTYVTLLQ